MCLIDASLNENHVTYGNLVITKLEKNIYYGYLVIESKKYITWVRVFGLIIQNVPNLIRKISLNTKKVTINTFH